MVIHPDHPQAQGQDMAPGQEQGMLAVLARAVVRNLVSECCSQDIETLPDQAC